LLFPLSDSSDNLVGFAISSHELNSHLGWVIGHLSVEAELSIDHGAEEVDISDQVLVEQLVHKIIGLTLGIDREGNH